jgi:hypothetical protein
MTTYTRRADRSFGTIDADSTGAAIGDFASFCGATRALWFAHAAQHERAMKLVAVAVGKLVIVSGYFFRGVPLPVEFGSHCG